MWQFGLSELKNASPGLLHGLRLTLAVCLALYTAFYLELDAPYWAGTSAAIVCQPSLGASRRKGAYRLMGTLLGAVFVVLLSAAFPQSRYGFLIGLALWGGVCGFVSSLLKNFASYSAALSGYTVAIIAGSATTSPDQIFQLAVYRASEISIGIVCATIVISATTLGRARPQLADDMAKITAELGMNIALAVANANLEGDDERSARRDLLRRITGLNGAIDTVLGEASDVAQRQQILWAGVDGMFAAASEWRTIAGRTGRESTPWPRQRLDLLESRQPEIWQLLKSGESARWLNGPAEARDACATAAYRLAQAEKGDPSSRLITDRTAAALRGLAEAANGLALLVAPERAHSVLKRQRISLVQDFLPPLVNALRVFVAIGAMELFWIISEWPSGSGAITFTFVSVILLSPKDEQAYKASFGFAFGTAVAILLAGLAKFGLLPAMQSFGGLMVVLAVNLIPLGALFTVQRFTPFLIAAVNNFTPLLSLTNIPIYDTGAFYNSALSIFAGTVAAAVVFTLIPPVPPAVRTRRLIGATMDGLRRLAAQSPVSRATWERQIYRRLAAMPDSATPVDRSRMITALAAGSEIILLRKFAARHDLTNQLQSCLASFSPGKLRSAITELQSFEQAVQTVTEQPGWPVIRARGAVLALIDALETHTLNLGNGHSP